MHCTTSNHLLGCGVVEMSDCLFHASADKYLIMHLDVVVCGSPTVRDVERLLPEPCLLRTFNKVL